MRDNSRTGVFLQTEVYRRTSRIAHQSTPARVAAQGGVIAIVLVALLWWPADFAANHGPDAVAALWLRASVIGIAWVTMNAHAQVLRSPVRPLWAGLPVDAVAVVSADARLLHIHLLAFCVALGGVALRVQGVDPLRVWTGFAVTALLTASAALLAPGLLIYAAGGRWSPEGLLARTLDQMRGSVPLEQAALVYAPGLLLLGLGGEALALTSLPSEPSWQMAALGASVLTFAFAQRWGQLRDGEAWFSAGASLEAIRLRYAVVDGPLQAQPVPWTGWVDRLSARLQPWVRAILAYGWRERRMALWGRFVWMAWVWQVAATGGAHAALLLALVPLWTGYVLSRTAEAIERTQADWLDARAQSLSRAWPVVLIAWVAVPGLGALVPLALWSGGFAVLQGCLSWVAGLVLSLVLLRVTMGRGGPARYVLFTAPLAAVVLAWGLS